eukprot:gene38821-51031_t
MDHGTDDLKDALRRKLDSKGVLKEIKARIRAEVFNAIEDKSITMPEKPPEVYLASELIKEFLDCFHLSNTLSVFVEESGQPTEMRTDRHFLANELGFSLPTGEQDGPMPLLIMIIKQLQLDRENKQMNMHSSTVVEAD